MKGASITVVKERGRRKNKKKKAEKTTMALTKQDSGPQQNKRGEG